MSRNATNGYTFTAAELAAIVGTFRRGDEVREYGLTDGHDAAAFEVGETVVAYIRGMWRRGKVSKVGKTNLTVECTTPAAIDEAARYGWSGPCLTAKVVKAVEVFRIPVVEPVTGPADAAAVEVVEVVEVVDTATGEVVEVPAELAAAVDAVYVPAEHTTREAWLIAAVDALRPVFASLAGVDLPAELLVSVGWPGGKSMRKVIGQCWPTHTAGVPHLYISPMLGADVVELLGCLAHELIHAWDDCKSKHGGAFLKAFRAVGMTGKATECAVGDELRPVLADIAAQLGEYPHRPVTLGALDAQPKQSTRMLKVECEADGYTVRMTRKWLDDLGAPTCPCGERMVEAGANTEADK